MKWRKLYEDILGALLLPFIIVAVAIEFALFLAVRWIADVVSFFHHRYSNSKRDEAGVASNLRDEVRDR